MKIETLAQAIGLSREALQCAMAYPFTKDKKLEGKALCHKEKEFLAFCRAQDQFRLFSLRLFLELAVDCEQEYLKQGISSQIYIDTFRDIAIWNENCKREFMEWGIDEICWLRFHICMEVFRLGRLAFQEIRLMEDIEMFHLKQGESVIEVHVAQGEPLDIEECKASFLAAMQFYHKQHAFFWGESWLLHPALKSMVPKDSNLSLFQDLFTVYDMDETSRQGEMRIFGFVSEDIEVYPEHTSLQRNLKTYLREHGSFGMGKGIYECVSE